MFCHTVQDARYSIGWFVWPCDDVLIQGPGKKYPPTTMKEFMKVTVPLKYRSQLSPLSVSPVLCTCNQAYYLRPPLKSSSLAAGLKDSRHHVFYLAHIGYTVNGAGVINMQLGWHARGCARHRDFRICR